MYRTHTCGELRIANENERVTLSGWVQRIRDKGGMIWVDLRDRYGVTQLMFDESKSDPQVVAKARELGREFVVQAQGTVLKRYSVNDKIPTGEIEIMVDSLNVLNASKLPPFMIENDTDGGDDLRMKYRYLDLRRENQREKLALRHRMMQETRRFLDAKEFMEVETPVLIKSTPEGARDFVVPSRTNKGEFYALPQSPQTFKQLLMVSGFDRYFQIVKCFRDEDLRADRQPEFTQIDCEMSFVEQEDILNTFEGMTKHLFKTVRGVELTEDFERMEYADAMKFYGSDKPDLRFGMPFVEINDLAKGKDFKIFDSAELIVGIKVDGCGNYTRKQLDALTKFMQTPQIGAKGLVHVKCNEDGSFKSSIDKFFSQEDLKAWAEKFGAKAGDLLLVMSGHTDTVRKQLCELRLKMGSDLGLRDPNTFKPLWVMNFPLLEWDEESQRYHAMHHPFTSPKVEDMPMLDTDPGAVRANAYDLVINGVEIGGGSIRIHDREMQQLMFKHLGFSEEEAKAQFGFLMEAFEYGAPPHGGIAFGFDRICSLFGGSDSIRDYIAFPKNNSGRDVMIDAPSAVDNTQLEELSIRVEVKED
ncbi:aspartate--tRNA ligase [Fulvitalea axinellae]|uniref:Aspartate--tRNA ligase n=1 Tax=Fulvitalea axinellae TaxID=1182444 RepID=A0AAU9D6K5_9BACT|nr:aspartate--tRNA ligase [Fulvitalea axinellae]